MRETDEALYNRYLKGDVSAMDTLISRHSHDLRLYLAALLRQDQDAEDMLVEAFARIMAKRPEIGEGRFRAYLFQTARNLSLRLISRRKRQVSFFPTEDLPAEGMPGETMTPELTLNRQEEYRTLYRSLDRLEPSVREALWLIYVENMSYAETAAVLDVSLKKVDNLLMKGKRLLRKELEKEGITHANG